MPVRATKRGAERTPFAPGTSADVLICGASFAGLAVARELRASGASVLVLDRYEIGERQTSACAAPTEWLENMGGADAVLQTFDSLLVHTPRVTARWPLPFTFSTFDYRRLCALLWEQCGEASFDVAKVDGILRPDAAGDSFVVHTDRGDLTASHVVDALGWRRVLGAGSNVQPPDARLSRGLEVHPRIELRPSTSRHRDLELWIDARYVSPGYSWSFPASDEVRVGVGSFDPRVHVKDPTLKLVADVGVPAHGFQGNWIPHALRPATGDGVWFAGDSAGHCLPLTAEGIRTALYFGVACGRELRSVLAGSKDEATAQRDYRAFSARHAWKFRALFGAQQAIRHLHGPVMDGLVRLFGRPRVSLWTFRHYLDIAPPSFALPAPPRAPMSTAGIEGEYEAGRVVRAGRDLAVREP